MAGDNENYSGFMVGVVIGPVLMGYMFDVHGDYKLAFLALTAVVSVGLILALLLRGMFLPFPEAETLRQRSTIASMNFTITDAPESKSGCFPRVVNGFFCIFPLSFKGEGDNRGEVDK